MESQGGTAVAVREKTALGQRISSGVILGLGASLLAGYIASGFFLFQTKTQAPTAVSIVAEESGARTDDGYTDRAPLAYCMQAQGGTKIAEHGNVANTGAGLYQWSRTSGWQGPFDAGDRPDDKLPDIRWRDLERVELRFVANRNEWNNMPLDNFRNVDVVRTDGTSEYALTLWQDIDTANNKWGWGGFAWGADDFQRMLNNQCENDDKWARVDVVFNNDDPNDPNAFVEAVNVRICSSNFAIFGLRVLTTLKARESCNISSTVVTADAENKAWAERTLATSQYTVPDLGYGYLSAQSPFGGASALPQGSGSAESSLPGYGLFEPLTQTTNAGTPYSCLGDCNASGKKYCYLTGLTTCGEPGGDNPPHYWDFCTTGVENTCMASSQIAACAGESMVSACVGVPLGRCSGNLMRPCDPADQNSCTGFGACLSPAAASNQPPSFAVAHLQRLFAKSYECKKLQADIQQVDRDGDGMDPNDPKELVYSYVACPANTLFPGENQTWDIGTDAPGGGPIYCPGERGANDYCALRPVLTDVRMNGQTGPITTSSFVTGTFQYSLDAEQKPLSGAAFVWEWDGNNPENACANATYVTVVDTGSVSIAHQYTTQGTYEVLACVRDNWSAIGHAAYSGTITVTGTDGGGSPIMKKLDAEQQGPEGI